jgi:hypothetical protein
MKFLNLLLILPVAVLSLSLTVGCGGSGETTVLPADDVGMTPEEEATYEEQSMSSVDDESQN